MSYYNNINQKLNYHRRKQDRYEKIMKFFTRLFYVVILIVAIWFIFLFWYICNNPEIFQH